MNTLPLLFRGAFYVLKYCMRHQENLKPILRSYRYYNKTIRISASAILNTEKDGRYLLIRNRHRTEQHSPFGGVFKHAELPPSILTEIQWQSDYTSYRPKLEDMKNDLRGIILGKNFPIFLDWLTQRYGREGEQCLYRELREELSEAKVGRLIRDRVSDIKICLDRRVLEGPYLVEERKYSAQFRYFEVFKPQLTDSKTNEIINKLFNRAANGGNGMILVSKEEIDNLRIAKTGEPIGAHAKYFFSSVWHGVEPPKY